MAYIHSYDKMVYVKVRLSVLLVLCVWNGAGLEEEGFRTCKFPAIYNFGDSNSDTGGGSAAFYAAGPPSGETFFHEPAGRASDGRLIIDFIAESLGLSYLGGFLDSIGTSFRQGANFAIGGSTIRPQNESWSQNGVSPFSLDIQVVQFKQFKERAINLYKRGVDRHNLPRPKDFSKALYTFDIGQNDIAAGFRTMTNKEILAVIPDITNQLSAAIKILYENNARTFWIHNTGPIGCLPVTLLGVHNPPPGYLDDYGCIKNQNHMAVEFNKQLKKKVIDLRKELPDAAITNVDVFAAKYELIGNAEKQGFVEKGEICCGYHEGKIHVWCGQKLKMNGTEIYAGSCEHPSSYISWDGVHYTQAANQWVASRLINGSFSDPPFIPITRACLSS